MNWSKQSGNTTQCYQLSQREKALIENGYEESLIRKVNHINDDTMNRIANEVFEYVVRDCVRTDSPKALFIGGQPGSGKSVIVRNLDRQTDYENFAFLCIDNYRTWHPSYDLIEEEIRKHWSGRKPSLNDTPGNDMAGFTHAFSSDLIDVLIGLLSKPVNGKYYSMCIEWGMRTAAQPLECMKLLKEKKYKNEVMFLCVPGSVSFKSCSFRDAFMNESGRIYRRVPESFHTLCVSTIAKSCGEMYQTGVLEGGFIDQFSLIDREQKVLWKHGDEGKPDEILNRVLLMPAEDVECSLNEARKTYYSESVGFLKKEKWFSYLIHSSEENYNPERVQMVEHNHRNYVLEYTERTLRYIASYEKDLPGEYYTALLRSMQWAEIAKAGNEAERELWMRKGFDLSVHNEASADIYLTEYQEESDWIRTVTEALIRSHGMMGQILRGETDFRSLQPLVRLLDENLADPDILARVLYAQNRAVIKSASNRVWQKVKKDILEMILSLCNTKKLPQDFTLLERLKRLFPHAFGDVEELTAEERKLYQTILDRADLWYPQVALDTFTREEIRKIFIILEESTRDGIQHISFERLMHTLYYDYEGMRRINIYKKRIMEYYLKDQNDPKTGSHVKVVCERQSKTMFWDIRFTAVCEKLVEFCVEAERSGIMEYQKNIVAIYDLFGFRRDIFDRLNNEEKYLETMNDTAASRKNEVVDYMIGKSVVDVGSGGGVLLDLLEKRYPDAKVTGTDISMNVIENLKQKIQKEGHHYQVIRHNFVERPLDEKTDNVIFSSILHEVYSYTEWNEKRFQIESVKQALKNAVASLKPGGRIIIRDGIMSEEKENCAIRFKSQEGVLFAKNYLNDFKGLTGLRKADGSWKDDAYKFEGDLLCGNVNLIREFLYTYTWGIESYSCEVNEQFGYFYLDEYVQFLKECGLKIIHAESYQEQGYSDNLNKHVELLSPLVWEDMPSSCIIVGERI